MTSKKPLSKVLASIALGYAVTCTANAFAQEANLSLSTLTGNTVGLTISGHEYKEPSLNVVINAPLLGVDYSGVYAFGNDWFVRGDARFAYGPAKYTDSGTQSNIPYSYYDVRRLFGYDFHFSEWGGLNQNLHLTGNPPLTTEARSRVN